MWLTKIKASTEFWYNGRRAARHRLSDWKRKTFCPIRKHTDVATTKQGRQFLAIKMSVDMHDVRRVFCLAGVQDFFNIIEAFVVQVLRVTLDFCEPSTSFFLPARRIKIPYPRTFSLAAGFVMEVQSVDFCEVRMEDLARTMREAYDAGRPALEAKRKAGLQLVQDRLNWANSVDHVEECLNELRDTVPRRIANARNEAASVYRRETALREMATNTALKNARGGKPA